MNGANRSLTKLLEIKIECFSVLSARPISLTFSIVKSLRVAGEVFDKAWGIESSLERQDDEQCDVKLINFCIFLGNGIKLMRTAFCIIF